MLARDRNLSAQRFDPEPLQRIGEPQAVATNIRSGFPIQAGDSRGFVFPSLGVAASPDRLVVRSTSAMQLTWFGLGGNPLGTFDERGQYTQVAISRDGAQLAAVKEPLRIWLYPSINKRTDRAGLLGRRQQGQLRPERKSGLERLYPAGKRCRRGRTPLLHQGLRRAH